MSNCSISIDFIIELVKKQYPEKTDLVKQLKLLNRAVLDRKPYISFVSNISPNRPGSKWQFKENVILKDEFEGTIIIDVLKDDRIGGIEFVDMLK